ncbi:MAG: hypothetical protein QW597_07180 [Thermoplasmataceae archaeon]
MITFHLDNVLVAIIAIISFISAFTIYLTKTKNGRAVKVSLAKHVNARHALIGLVLLLLVFNVLAGPLNTNNSIPTTDSGYAFSFTLNPEFHAAKSLAGMIPINATVAASDNLFPLVSTDMNAYSFYWLPMNELGRPGYYNFSNPLRFQYIFVDQSQLNLVPSIMVGAITNSSLFGVLASVVSTDSYPGNITLYERNYSGSETVIFA